MTPERWILHCDCNSFYASVELLAHPELLNTPVAVCGDPEGRHGIVLAKNEAAKKYHIQTAETIWSARSKCPNLVLLPPHREKYSHYCRVINDIYEKYSDRVEAFSIDESWLDITHTWHLFAADPIALANQIRREVQAVTGLTISVGVSFNKVFAKLGSDYKKPDATTVISRENWRDIVWPLPVGDLLFVGRAAQRTLGQYGVETIGQLAACKPEMLEQLMGKMGVQLYRYANGLDDAPVRPQHQREPVKSVGNSTTFPENLTRWEEIRSGLQLLSDSVAGRLRKEGLYCGGVAVAVKDAQFRTVSRQMRLGAPTHLMRDIFEAAQELTRRIWKAPTPVRLLSVTALYITDSADSYQQLDLLAGDAPLRDQRQEQLESAMDAIRGKYGRDAITFGRGGKVGWNKDE